MARGRKLSLNMLEEKIEAHKIVLEKSKLKYEKDKEELAMLIQKRNELRQDELMKAVALSDRSYEEIMNFINGANQDEY